MKRPLVWITAAAASACLCSLLLPRIFVGILAGGLCLLLCAVLWRVKKFPALGLLFLGLALGFLWSGAYCALFYAPTEDLAYKTIRLDCVVTDYPKAGTRSISVPVKGGEDGGRRVSMLLRLDESFSSLKPGDVISCVAYCTPTSDSDLALSYRAKGIYLFARAYGPVDVSASEGFFPAFAPARMGGAIRDMLQRLFPAETVGLVEALLTGWTENISDADDNALRQAGLSHVVSVSGMHVSFLAGALAFFLNRQRKSTVVIQCVVIVLFTLMAGAPPGAVRAAFLCIAALAAPHLGRSTDAATSLCGALLLLLALNPASIASIGLQLSFAATLGIYLVGQPLDKHWREILTTKKLKLLSPLSSLMAVSVGAILFTVPLSALYFGQTSLIAPLTNLVTEGLVALVFFGGIVSSAVGFVYLPFGEAVAFLVDLPTRLFLWIAQLSGSIPFAAIELQSVYYQLVLVFFYAMALAIFWGWRKGQRRFILPVSLCVMALCLSFVLTNVSHWRQDTTFALLDVGQGQSIALSSGRSRAVIDCGSMHQSAGDIAANYFHSLGYSSIDFLILTHYHDDHANGAAELLSRMTVSTILMPDTDRDAALRLEIEAVAAEKGSEIHYITAPTEILFGEGRLTVYPPFSQEGENEAGLTILYSMDEWDALVTGDMGSETELALLSTYPLPDLELFVAGHHGSKYSSSEVLLEKLLPEICLISVGKYNTFGHPAPEALARFADISAAVYRTDTAGTITISVNREGD